MEWRSIGVLQRPPWARPTPLLPHYSITPSLHYSNRRYDWPDHYLISLDVDPNQRPIWDFAGDQRPADFRFERPLDRPLERPCAINRIVSGFRQMPPRGLS